MLILALVVWLIVLVFVISSVFRVTVPPNEVHIVQWWKTTTAYWKWFESKVYYNRRPWLPVIGCVRVELPISVFDITISNYQAYDVGRVPFGIDVKAFFRISDPILSAERIEDYNQLFAQLHDVLKSSIRSILASSDIEEILWGRAEFSDKFTSAVREQLSKDRWVEVVKNIEFMEIRDWEGSEVISNIQKKKESLILKESRVEIAKNNKDAEIAEIEANQQADIRSQEARQLVWVRTVEAEKIIQLEGEKSQQEVKEQARITKEKEMEVRKVEQVKWANIDREKEVIEADKEAQKVVIKSKGDLDKATNDANAVKIAAEAESNRIKIIGKSEWEAISAKEIASMAGKVELMEKMKENKDYAEFLKSIEAIVAGRDVGVAQAEALKSASIKYLGTDGKINPSWGLSSLLTPGGLANLWLGLEALSETTDMRIIDLYKKIVELPKEEQESIISKIEEEIDQTEVIE